MTVIVRSLIGASQTLDSVVLPPWATQTRNASTAALVAAVAARSIQMDDVAGVEYSAPLTGVSYQVPNLCEALFIRPAGTIAAHTLVMPQAPVDRQRLRVTSQQAITALTMTPGAGQTIQGALTAFTANGFAEWQYNDADKNWYRMG